MKQHNDLRRRIIAYTLLPGVIAALLIGAYLTYALLRDISNYEKITSSAYGEQIGTLAYDAMRADNLPLLQHIALAALENPLIHSISFYDRQKQDLVHAGPQHQHPTEHTLNPFTNHKVEINDGDHRQIFVPVERPRLSAEWVARSGHASPNNPDDSVGWLRIEFSSSHLLLHKYKTILIDTAIIALILMFTLWLAIPFSNRLTGAIVTLTRKATDLSKGNVDDDIAQDDISELPLLADAIDNIQRFITQQQNETQQYIELSTQDLRDNLETIEIQNIELDLARREAVQANRVKSQFLANTSHEIRTPLNSIIGFSRLLLKTPLSAQQQDYLESIHKSSEGLLTLINDVLDLSKMEAGKLVLDYIPFNIHESIEDILQILAVSAHEKGLELLQITYSDVPRHLLGDPQRLKQVLTNLISNAIKFSERGKIVVRVTAEKLSPQQAQLKVEVTDSGIGLPNDQHTIFTAFKQLDSSSTREHNGTGLGLAIAKKLVEQMSGDINYTSEPGNTTFWFTFRADIAPHSAGTPPSQLANRHILLYDRDPSCRLALSHSLTNWGVQPLLADTPDQILPALDRYRGSELPIEAVIWSMPIRPSGQHFAQLQNLLQGIISRYSCKIIVCMTGTMPLNAEQALQESPNNNVYTLPKPVTEKRLYETLCLALDIEQNEVGATRLISSKNPDRTDTESCTHILAVDDNPSNLKLISIMLHSLGYIVFEAASGQQALRVLQEKAIDIIFMDIQMPVMDGIETTQRIRQIEQPLDKHTPVIALTAHALAEQRQHLLMAGLDDYLSKPATERQLQNMIEKWTNPARKKSSRDQNLPTPELPLPENKSSAFLSCVDRNAALQASGGRVAISVDIFHTLLSTLAAEREQINDAIQQNDWHVAEHLTHRLHGSCSYCGVPLLKNCCQALEAALKKRNLRELPTITAAFNAAVDALLLWQTQHDVAAFLNGEIV